MNKPTFFESKRILELIGTIFLVCCGLMGVSHIVLADTGGRTAFPELTGTITIDDEGMTQCSDADWPAGAGEFMDISSFTDVSGGPDGIGKMLIHHPDNPIDDQELYVFFRVDDNTSDVSINIDNLVLMFDLSHDHTVATTSSFDASDDRGIRFRRSNTADSVYGNINNPQVQAALPDARVCIWEQVNSVWYIEAKIIPSDIGLNNFNALMGVALLVDDHSGGITKYRAWPSGVTADPNTWANVITRPPIDFVLVIDQSGSMGGSKWASVKQAGNHLRAVLAQMHDTGLSTEFSSLGVSGGGDRLGLAAFSTSLSGNADVHRTLASIDSTPADYTGVLPGSPGGGTPMAAGVNQAFEMYGGAGSLGAAALADPKVVRQKVVMLLSDGKHNSPSTTLNFDSPGVDFDYLPTAPNCDTAMVVDSLVRVNTAAIGTDATVSTGKLDQIKDCFSGSRLTNIYNITGADEAEHTAKITREYFETLYPYYHLNMLTDSGGNFTVKAGERRLLIFAFWADTTLVTSLSIQKPDSSVVNGTCPASLGYCYILIDNPDEGTYINYTATAAVANGKYALLDLRVEGRFALDNEPHGTSSTITLRGRLQDDGQPILGANVRVDVFRPEEGFGTVASTNDINCKVTRPQLPNFDVTGGDHSTVALGGNVVFSSANLNLQQTTTNGDINPLSFALMDAILNACGKDDLDRTNDTGLQLYDDSTHGDVASGDGIYTLSFDNTEIEGSYVFRFTADGNLTNGQPFNRIKEIGEYVRLDVDPSNTETGSRLIQQTGNIITEEHHVIPRDIHGGYLGPGHSDQIEFLISGAVPVGSVRDYNNGIYAQVVLIDRSQGKPVTVIPVIQGQPIGPTCPECAPHGIPIWIWWLLIILSLLLLFCLLKCCWHRKAY